MNGGRRSDSEQAILYALIALVGMIPVVVVLASGGVFGSEATIGLLMLCAALAGLLATWRIARNRGVRH